MFTHVYFCLVYLHSNFSLEFFPSGRRYCLIIKKPCDVTFNNIVLTPLVFPYQHSCENLDKVLSMWNSCFKTSKRVQFSKYVALPQLLTRFVKNRSACKKPHNSSGDAKTGFLPPFTVSSAFESEESLQLLCFENWFHFKPELKSKSNVTCSHKLL